MESHLMSMVPSGRLIGRDRHPGRRVHRSDGIHVDRVITPIFDEIMGDPVLSSMVSACRRGEAITDM